MSRPARRSNRLPRSESGVDLRSGGAMGQICQASNVPGRLGPGDWACGPGKPFLGRERPAGVRGADGLEDANLNYEWCRERKVVYSYTTQTDRANITQQTVPTSPGPPCQRLYTVSESRTKRRIAERD
jgi:hypothetical protein